VDCRCCREAALPIRLSTRHRHGGPLDSYICPAPRRCEPEAKDQSREQAHHRNANRDQAHFRRIHLANPLSGRDRRKRGGEGYEKHLTMPTRRHASSLKPVASSANRAWRGIGRVRDGQPLGELACLLIGHRVRSTGPLVSGLSEGAHTTRAKDPYRRMSLIRPILPAFAPARRGCKRRSGCI